MNKKLATKAVEALTGPGFESRSGFCLRWTRQVVQSVYGSKYDAYWTASATETMAKVKGSPYAVKVDNTLPAGGSQVGDILLKGTKTSGKYGHVGIRVIGNKVAENSSAHTSGTDREARGLRSLDAFGSFELIMRLPE